MTVPVQNPFTSSVANGVTTVFPYNFMIADDADIKVVVDDVVQTSGYTVTGIGNPAGGDVIFSVAPANGLKVLRYLDPLLKRETDYQQFGDFLADTVNLDFDKIWLALQAINQNFKRSLKLPVDTTTDQAITEDATSRIGKVVSFDSSGNMVLLLPADLSAATLISAYMETLLAAIDAADARTILELVIGTDVQAFMDSASQVEMEAGTEAALRAMSPLRVRQALAVNNFTEDTTPDTANDFALVWDASASANKKVKLNKIGAAVGNSMVRLNTANGYGSTNTKIRRFTNTVTNTGSDITYADSATLGASFTINTNGVYAISYSDTFATAQHIGISLNTSAPTTNLDAIPVSEVLSEITTAGGASAGAASWVGYLPAGSVVRAHNAGAAVSSPANSVQFTITRVA